MTAISGYLVRRLFPRHQDVELLTWHFHEASDNLHNRAWKKWYVWLGVYALLILGLLFVMEG